MHNHTKQIFICDDSVENTLWLKSALLIHGFKSKIFLSGVALLDFLDNKPDLPDLLIVDLKMPVISGLEIIQKIKQSHKLKSIPIILITGIDKFDIENINHVEINGFIRKAIDLDTLIASVTALLPKD
ncbi:response regulator receiver protein [Tolypothrix tenuis PCC 7101]|uniref:Response regulator receiver protein n=1 Tax=Tolypothrix tenuis PCC 7101 TaxID=231146 RepID=A0A1Z4MZM8_9CYAN|nr:response regulator [Aulosira sp. FACHB-113]BAY98948.1 response regulator receiver protein [Tolypothrix tenuis PCC 7101]BAZ77133.1 response regulator receiver protein [Aulosira laxa NIES-50]